MYNHESGPKFGPNMTRSTTIRATTCAMLSSTACPTEELRDAISIALGTKRQSGTIRQGQLEEKVVQTPDPNLWNLSATLEKLGGDESLLHDVMDILLAGNIQEDRCFTPRNPNQSSPKLQRMKTCIPRDEPLWDQSVIFPKT